MASGTSSGKPEGFVSEFVSDLSQSQDLNSFLKKNQPTYDPNSHTSSSSSPTATLSSSNNKDKDSKSQENTSSSASPSTSTKFVPSSGSTEKPIDVKMLAASQKIANGHLHYQRQAIHTASLDNCADLNMELKDCLVGKSGTWWDRASMCMKAKEQLQKCCTLNKEILQERGYAREGNTPEKDREIQDYADEQVQKIIKEEEEENKKK
ncbi:hypothetical protein BGZ46_005313 [Entomortierella lignicola]|nr:hypothetical protein BGZ46_005313 [Entomortierella lignicola]